MRKKTFGIIGICLILFFSVLGYPAAKGATLDKIAYVHGNALEQPNAVWVMDSDGTNRHQITHPPENYYDYGPTWSPDGSKIAFNRSGNLVSHIFIINSDGTNEQQLTSGDVDDWGPAWSPDGTRIAFNRRSAIWIVNSDGTNGQQITFNSGEQSDYSPTWSPDSIKISYVHYDLSIGERIWKMEADGSNPQQLTTSGYEQSPAWSPLGTKIAYRRYVENEGGSIYLINTDGSNEIRISYPPEFWDDSSPAWSPDGTRIAFERQFPDALEAEIWVMDADGGNLHMINEAGNHPAWWGPKVKQRRPQMPSLLPIAQNNVVKSNDLQKQADDLLTQAKSKNLNTNLCEKLIDEADELLEKAKKNITNPMYANNLALKAIEKLKEAIDCLKVLLG